MANNLAWGKDKLKYVCSIVVFLIAILVSPLAYVNIMQAQGVSYTAVGSIINEDTTWTSANSPYSLTGNLRINAGVTLTIEAGVQVIFNGYYMQVDGTLTARGSSADDITFTGGQIMFRQTSNGWNESTGKGCIIENCVLNRTMVTSTDASPKFNSDLIYGGNYFSTMMSFNGGTPVISNNTIIGKGTEYELASIACGCDATIVGNFISGWRTDVWIHAGSPLVESNIIINSTGLFGGAQPEGGIAIMSTASPIIRNNTIANNTGAGIIIEDVPSPVIIGNNIFDNSYNVYLQSASTLKNYSFPNNWWGTTTASEINQTIYDFKNDFNLGKVTFEPFLSAPNPQAPAIPVFTITASAGTGGSISPSGSVNVTYGESKTFNVTANSGYRIARVLMDGTPAKAPYVFTNVTANDHTITATFEPSPISAAAQSVVDYLDAKGFDVTFVYFGSNTTLTYDTEDCALVVMRTYEHVKNFQFTATHDEQFREGNNSLHLAYPNAEVFIVFLFEDLDIDGTPDNWPEGNGYYEASGSRC